MYADNIVSFFNKTFGKVDFGINKNIEFKIPEKVLVVLPGFVGDVILFTPMLRNIRRNIGINKTLDVICTKNVVNIIEPLSYIDQIHTEEFNTKDKIDFLKNEGYDTVFLFNFPFWWARACYKAAVKQRVSFDLHRLGIDNIFIWQKFITHQLPSTSVKDHKHQSDVYLDTLKSINMQVYDRHFEVKLTKNDLDKAEELVRNLDGLKILINITAGSPGKAWPVKNWLEIIKYLKNSFNCSIIATGTSREKGIYDLLASESGIQITNLCGQTTIRETISLYKSLDLVITVDTASAHFAAIADAKNIIVIYGPTNHLQWAPRSDVSNIYQVYVDLPCRPCITRTCSHRNCINKLTPEMVIKSIKSIDFNKKT